MDACPFLDRQTLGFGARNKRSEMASFRRFFVTFCRNRVFICPLKRLVGTVSTKERPFFSKSEKLSKKPGNFAGLSPQNTGVGPSKRFSHQLQSNRYLIPLARPFKNQLGKRFPQANSVRSFGFVIPPRRRSQACIDS